MPSHFDLAVIGGGSGGIGAAIAGARLGLSVLLVEKADMLGGNAVRGGVHAWERGVGGTGIPFDIYRRLKRIPNAVSIYSFGRHCAWKSPQEEKTYPGGEHRPDPTRCYLDSLRCHGARSMAQDENFCRQFWHGVVFEPEPYSRIVEELLAETGHCSILKNTAFTEVSVKDGRIASLSLDNGQEVEALGFVDGTADALLCLACGCEMMVGEESHARFGEPSAPEKASNRVNAVTLIYRVAPVVPLAIEPMPADIPAKCWWKRSFPWSFVGQYPCGDRNINMLPTMEGEEFMRLGYPAALAECRRRVYAHWHDLQTNYPEFQRYRISWIAPALGVRETRRVIGEYVLTQHDLLAGIHKQQHPDIVTIADHGMDTHGDRGVRGELPYPYGVPFRCMIPKGFRNLLVACRAASFSSIAASSCRLSRTMMQLGQAAGTAVALAKSLQVDLPEVPSEPLRQSLRQQHVELDWPRPQELLDYLQHED